MPRSESDFYNIAFESKEKMKKNFLMKSKVSILIPVYNTSKYLSKCINSLINQTYKNIEIIAVNDGSTDNSKTLLEKFAEKDSRITVLSQENGGSSMARKTVLEHSTGDYVMFVDSDDYLDRSTVQECMQSVKKATRIWLFSVPINL